ncbi:MAG TPA: SRPBCC family protein [Chitinophagaceae bacterium]|nr:SRPBCC family protein [Chitinophagaceae bacterium]HUM64891.1 SRPBCC family protein [Chitinophagaceae bacterium]
MPTIHLTTFIAAPVERVFDLARSVEMHKHTMTKHKEEAVAGTRFGLMEKNDTVTWKARHLFKTRFLRSEITDMKKPAMFVDEQLKGDFKKMRHEHHFKPCDNGTIMIDLLEFEPPYGSFGKFVSRVYLNRYMKNLIEQRNKQIKEFAEGEKWRKFLNR